MTSQPKKEHDAFLGLKHIGYCISQLPSTGGGYAAFVAWAKWQLCEARGYLMKDPVWETYGDEEILVEYYALTFTKDKQEREEFLAQIQAQATGEGSFLDWTKAEEEKNKSAVTAYLAKKKQELEKAAEEAESFEYVPGNEIPADKKR